MAETHLTVGQTVYDDEGTKLGTVRGFDGDGFFVTTRRESRRCRSNTSARATSSAGRSWCGGVRSAGRSMNWATYPRSARTVRRHARTSTTGRRISTAATTRPEAPTLGSVQNT